MNERINPITLKFKDRKIQDQYDKEHTKFLLELSIATSILEILSAILLWVFDQDGMVYGLVLALSNALLLLLHFIFKKIARWLLLAVQLLNIAFWIVILEMSLVSSISSQVASQDPEQVKTCIISGCFQSYSLACALIIIVLGYNSYRLQTVVVVALTIYFTFRINSIRGSFYYLTLGVMAFFCVANYLQKRQCMKRFLDIYLQYREMTVWRQILDLYLPLNVCLASTTVANDAQISYKFVNQSFKNHFKCADAASTSIENILKKLIIADDEIDEESRNDDLTKLSVHQKIQSQASPREKMEKINLNCQFLIDDSQFPSNQQLMASYDSSHTFLGSGSKRYDVQIRDFSWQEARQVLITINDVSSKYHEEQIKKFTTYQNKIQQNMSHNLKTPLNGLFLIIYKLFNTVSDIQLQKFIKVIEINCILLNCFINDIVDYSSIINKQFQLDIIPFPIEQLIKEIQLIFGNSLIYENTNISFEFKNTDPNSQIINDYGRTKQIFVNLISSLVYDQNQLNNLKVTFKKDDSVPNVLQVILKSNQINNFLDQFKKVGQNPILETNLPRQGKEDTQTHNYDIQINLEIAKMLLKKVGPNNSLRIYNLSPQNQYVQFLIYFKHIHSANLTSSANKLSMDYYIQHHSQPLSIQNFSQDKELSNQSSQFNLPSQQGVSLFGAQAADIPSEPCMNHQIYAIKIQTQQEKNQVANHQLDDLLSPRLRMKDISKSLRILIVDDNSMNIFGLKNLLLHFNDKNQVDAVFNGKEAVNLIESKIKSDAEDELYDLIFMDVSMPVMDGFRATSLIRQLQESKCRKWRPLIVMVTAYTEQDGFIKSMSSGADYYMSKPLKLEKIQSLLNLLIK